MFLQKTKTNIMKNKTSSNSNRRSFLKKTSLASLGVLGLGQMQAQNFPATKKLSDALPKDLKILFQGDSITDAGRKRGSYYANSTWGGLGAGYPILIAGKLLGEHPNSNLKIYNRGISGDKVFQLSNRWEEDCLHIRPNILSILIGVNDFWHTLTHNYKGTANTYEDDLKKLLDRTLKEIPDLKLIICEPFVIKGGTAVEEKDWFPAFMNYQNAAQKIASDYNAGWVPFQKTFDDALKNSTVEALCPDGVHPSLGGGYLMAQAWLEVFEEMMNQNRRK